MTSRLVQVGLVGLVLGLTALAWAALRLPGRELVRGHLGDVGIVMFLVAGFGLAMPRRGPRVWIGLAALIALGTEIMQALGVRGTGLLGELTIGSTFDPFDLLAYAIGLAVSATWLRGATLTGSADPRSAR